MTHPVTLQIPDEIFRSVLLTAQKTGRKPEDVLVGLLAQSFQQPKDPLLDLAGKFSSPLVDVGSRHDQLLGEALLKETRGGERG